MDPNKPPRFWQNIRRIQNWPTILHAVESQLIASHKYQRRQLTTSSNLLMKNHYDVMELTQNCSQKDIKDAFIKLSKKLHPDSNPKNPHLHDQFVKLNEAYRILGNPSQREIYDSDLRSYMRYMSSYNGVKTNAPFHRVVWKDDTIWEMRDRSRDKYYRSQPYYGIPGIPRVSNAWIACGCVLLMLAGAVFHYVALNHSTTFSRERMKARDEYLTSIHSEIRKQALENGNEVQLKRMRKRLEEKDEEKTGTRK